MAGSHGGCGALPDRRYWRPTPGCLPLGSRSREPAATPSAAGSYSSQVRGAITNAANGRGNERWRHGRLDKLPSSAQRQGSWADDGVARRWRDRQLDPEPAAVRGKFTLGEEVRSCSTEAAASGPPADELRSTPGAVHHRSGQEDCDCGGPSRDDSLLTLLG